ncbi:ATP-binding cassette domain-containing protein [Arcanobacterium hippocoleae]
MIQRISRISKWLIRVTKSVLRPLALSTIFRHLYFFAHLTILTLGIWMVASLMLPETAAGRFPWPLWIGITILVILTLLKAIFNYFEHFLGHLVAFKALEILRVEFYRAMIPIATENSRKSGDLLLRATKDIDRIEVFFAHTFAPAVTAVTIPLISLLAAGPFVGWAPSLIAVCGLALSIFAVPALGIKQSFESAATASIARANLAQHVTDSIQGMAEVTGYGRTHERLEQMRQLDALLGIEQRPRRIWTAIRNGLTVITSLGTVLAVAGAGSALGVPPINLSIFTILVWGLFSVTSGVRDFAADLDNSLAAAERVYDVAHTAAAVTSPENPYELSDGALNVEFDSVNYRYPNKGTGAAPAVQDVSFTVPAGSHTCLIGLSGCGKSTILKLIARHFDPSDGSVLFNGTSAKDLQLDRLRRRVLLVEQTATLFNTSIEGNLRLAVPDASEAELLHALELVELREEIEPRGGLSLEVGESGNLLSGGQRQRLALARAILLRPDVLLLDEYTSHLDNETANRVRENLRRELPELTIVESTHSPQALHKPIR